MAASLKVAASAKTLSAKGRYVSDAGPVGWPRSRFDAYRRGGQIHKWRSDSLTDLTLNLDFALPGQVSSISGIGRIPVPAERLSKREQDRLSE